MLTEELLELPALVRQLVEAQARTEQRVAELAGRVGALDEALPALVRRVADLGEAQGRSTAQLEALAGRVGTLDGEVVELRYARRAPAYFSRLARRLRVLEPGAVADLLDVAIEQGQLTEDERAAVLEADLVLAGQRREDRVELYLVVEVSSGIGLQDAQRAVDRAGMLAKLGRPVVPVVAGRRINPEARAFAEDWGVWQVLDGQAHPPGQG